MQVDTSNAGTDGRVINSRLAVSWLAASFLGIRRVPYIKHQTSEVGVQKVGEGRKRHFEWPLLVLLGFRAKDMDLLRFGYDRVEKVELSH